MDRELLKVFFHDGPNNYDEAVEFVRWKAAKQGKIPNPPSDEVDQIIVNLASNPKIFLTPQYDEYIWEIQHYNRNVFQKEEVLDSPKTDVSAKDVEFFGTDITYGLG